MCDEKKLTEDDSGWLQDLAASIRYHRIRTAELLNETLCYRFGEQRVGKLTNEQLWGLEEVLMPWDYREYADAEMTDEELHDDWIDYCKDVKKLRPVFLQLLGGNPQRANYSALFKDMSIGAYEGELEESGLEPLDLVLLGAFRAAMTGLTGLI